MFNWFAEDPSSEEITTLPNANINTSRTKGGRKTSPINDPTTISPPLYDGFYAGETIALPNATIASSPTKRGRILEQREKAESLKYPDPASQEFRVSVPPERLPSITADPKLFDKRIIEPDEWLKQPALLYKSPTTEEIIEDLPMPTRKVVKQSATEAEYDIQDLLPKKKAKSSFLSRKDILDSIVVKYKSQPKKDKNGYFNAIDYNGFPLNYVHMVLYEKGMLLDLRNFVGLGFDKLNIRQADFYDFYHLLYYSGLVYPEDIPYNKEELSMLSSLSEYDLRELIMKLGGKADLKELDNNHAYMLFYIISGGLLPPVILKTKAEKYRYTDMADRNPFHVLVYLLGNMDNYMSHDFANYPPYHAAATVEAPSSPIFYQMDDLEPTVESMTKFLRKHVAPQIDLSTDIIRAFLEFIAVIRSQTKGEPL